jgi:hypothetical protein
MENNNASPNLPQDNSDNLLLSAVDSAISAFQQRLTEMAGDDNIKWSISDLMKLIQIRTQLQGDRPRNITVRWVDLYDTEYNNN